MNTPKKYTTTRRFLLAAAVIALIVPMAFAGKGNGKPGGGGGGGDPADPAIAFVRMRTATSGKLTNEGALMVMDADGSNQTVLFKEKVSLSGGYEVRQPSWSPNGAKIAFARVPWGSGSGWGIYTIALDGTNMMRVTPGPGGAPAWSPDGARIAYVKSGDVWIIDADGTNDTQVTSTGAAEGAPTWSPAGDELAYARQGDLMVHDLASGVITNVTAGGPLSGAVLTDFRSSSVDWARTQDEIAVVDTASDLWIIDLGDPTHPTKLGGTASSPSWSPDDLKLVFDREGGIYVIGADGTGETLLAQGTSGRKTSEELRSPDWRR